MSRAWRRQRHDEVDPRYDSSPAKVYDAFLADTMGQRTLTEDALTSWRPPAPTRGRRAARGRRSGAVRRVALIGPYRRPGEGGV